MRSAQGHAEAALRRHAPLRATHERRRLPRPVQDHWARSRPCAGTPFRRAELLKCLATSPFSTVCGLVTPDARQDLSCDYPGMEKRSPLPGAQVSDPPAWRAVFVILQGRDGEWLRAAVFLVVVLAFAVALMYAVGPWVSGALSAAGALTGGARAITRSRRDRQT